MKRILALFLFCFMVTSVWPTTPAAAQSLQSGLGGTNGSTLVASPRFPEPNQTVRLELNDFSVNTIGATYTWFIDGIEFVAARNQRAIDVSTGDLGTNINVLVRTRLTNGAILETRANIAPIRVDMLIEADTLVPSFYKGRAIPTSGSVTRVTAIPFTGDNQPPSTYSYTWRIGDTVISGGSRQGQNSVTFTPGFQRSVEVSVDIIDRDGNLLTTKTIYVPISDPELYFYPVDPLQGMSERAIDDRFIFIGEEVRVRAEPYFVDRTLMAQNPLLEWSLNNQSVTNPSQDQQEIVLRKSGQSGQFTLEFHVRNLRQLLQGVRDSITITF